MTVAVQKGLEHLTEALRGYGFDVVVYGEYQYPVDALVYMGEKMPMGESMPLTQCGEQCKPRAPRRIYD